MLEVSDYQNGLMPMNGPMGGPGPGDGTTTPALSLAQKQSWNNFIDYLDKAGYKGNTALDNRDTNLGRELMAKYNAANPGSQIKYEDIPAVQTALQQYRQSLINNWRAGKSVPDASVKTEADLMPGLSKIDGWLGSKTSSYKFPTATITHTDGTKQDFGVNTDLYDKLIHPNGK